MPSWPGWLELLRRNGDGRISSAVRASLALRVPDGPGGRKVLVRKASARISREAGVVHSSNPRRAEAPCSATSRHDMLNLREILHRRLNPQLRPLRPRNSHAGAGVLDAEEDGASNFKGLMDR